MKTYTITVTDEEEKAVDEAIQPYRKLISDTPFLLSLLYDIDLCPEQITHMPNAMRMIAICELYKRSDKSLLLD